MVFDVLMDHHLHSLAELSLGNYPALRQQHLLKNTLKISQIVLVSVSLVLKEN